MDNSIFHNHQQHSFYDSENQYVLNNDKIQLQQNQLIQQPESNVKNKENYLKKHKQHIINNQIKRLSENNHKNHKENHQINQLRNNEKINQLRNNEQINQLSKNNVLNSNNNYDNQIQYKMMDHIKNVPYCQSIMKEKNINQSHLEKDHQFYSHGFNSATNNSNHHNHSYFNNLHITDKNYGLNKNRIIEYVQTKSFYLDGTESSNDEINSIQQKDQFSNKWDSSINYKNICQSLGQMGKIDEISNQSQQNWINQSYGIFQITPFDINFINNESNQENKKKNKYQNGSKNHKEDIKTEQNNHDEQSIYNRLIDIDSFTEEHSFERNFYPQNSDENNTDHEINKTSPIKRSSEIKKSSCIIKKTQQELLCYANYHDQQTQWSNKKYQQTGEHEKYMPNFKICNSINLKLQQLKKNIQILQKKVLKNQSQFLKHPQLYKIGKQSLNDEKKLIYPDSRIIISISDGTVKDHKSQQEEHSSILSGKSFHSHKKTQKLQEKKTQKLQENSENISLNQQFFQSPQSQKSNKQHYEQQILSLLLSDDKEKSSIIPNIQKSSIILNIEKLEKTQKISSNKIIKVLEQVSLNKLNEKPSSPIQINLNYSKINDKQNIKSNEKQNKSVILLTTNNSTSKKITDEFMKVLDFNENSLINKQNHQNFMNQIISSSQDDVSQYFQQKYNQDDDQSKKSSNSFEKFMNSGQLSLYSAFDHKQKTHEKQPHSNHFNDQELKKQYNRLFFNHNQNQNDSALSNLNNQTNKKEESLMHSSLINQSEKKSSLSKSNVGLEHLGQSNISIQSNNESQFFYKKINDQLNQKFNQLFA